MNDLKLFLIALSLLRFVTTYAQEESVLEAPGNWRTERINFPLSFAPEINLKGFEDIRFSPGWSDSTSTDFWTYTFVWYIDEGESFDAERLTS